MLRIGMIALVFLFLHPLPATEVDDPPKPLGFSLSDHWFFTLGLEGGIRYMDIEAEDDGWSLGSVFFSSPWLPSFGFRYHSERNEFLWMNTGLLGYARDEDIYKDADLNEVQYIGLSFGASTLLSGHFLKDGPASFGFRTGFIFAYLEGDMFMDRFATHSLWERPPDFTVPFQFFISGKENPFSVTLSTSLSPGSSGDIFGYVIPTTASASVRIMPLLDLCYEGGMTVWTFGDGVVNWHEVGIAYQLSSQITMKALAGYARLPVKAWYWDEKEDFYRYRSHQHNDAAFEFSFDIANEAATSKTVIGIRRLPLSYRGWRDPVMANDFFLDFRDRSVVPWFLIGFNGDVAWVERRDNQYRRPVMYIRFLPYIAATFWDILTWRLATTLSVLPTYKDENRSSASPDQFFNKSVESTITIAY